jgi:hypothetical protein
MDVLCTDKTGTLTEDRVVLQRHCNLAGRETEEVLLDGYLISYFQTGLKNLLDRAILDSRDFHGQAVVEKYKKLDELPFDFTRRMMSVLVETPEGKPVLLTPRRPLSPRAKGAFGLRRRLVTDGKEHPMITYRCSRFACCASGIESSWSLLLSLVVNCASSLSYSGRGGRTAFYGWSLAGRFAQTY